MTSRPTRSLAETRMAATRMIRPLLAAVLMAILVTMTPSLVAAQQENFPLRAYYPEVPYITTADLLVGYDDIMVLDIRSRFEHDVANINKAILLPLNDPDFADKLEKLRPKTSDTAMAFYCNGHSCAKSYQAVQVALSLGFNNVCVYDGGIFDWIDAAPDKATLMGETPARADRVIAPVEYLTRLLDYDAFVEKAREKDVVVIDIRDPFQRDVIPNIDTVKPIPLDPLLNLVVSRIWTEKHLLFFDAVGSQVRWLQYFLESYGYFEYSFLKGGIEAIANDPDKIRPVIETNRSIVSNQEMLLKLTGDLRLDNSDRKILGYLLANVKFNNYIVVDMATAGKALGVSRDLLMASVQKLTRYRYATHSTMQDTLIVQVDPRLGWKGRVGDKAWDDTMSEFEKQVQQ
ncbi:MULTISPECIES: rhodanese-like domain-containing protein [Pseudodesulfovibrio]|uniref:Rhodanese domain protein n=1 Tax=Pseudodesulfovibrio aespoeensis (strain ATCC 700646 / DSM 10631 / Aspo-2) TaxID=643562 RepID=E6VYT1_PSEA9|nr:MULTISPECIES: rhodanese-like domain-containing protein [Pseudodesulfovibrio]ADU63948.1 Rhodanese domain protein [Pseudodesulfovibrio aespoeensis Aspo-2]MCG2732187.1 rhodanese-like domain-containing protein [Pseudodesulfovibrio aespoeensis]